MFIQFTERGVVWQDGTHQKVDAVIFATGYKPNFSYLHLLGGEQRNKSNCPRSLLYRNVMARSFASTTLWGVGDDANFVVKNIRKYIRSPFKQRLAVIQ